MHSLFIAPATSKVWFDAQAEALGNGGPALVLALSASGQEPATHGWCGVQLSAEREAAVAELLKANPDKQVIWRTYDLSTQPDYPDSALAELGLKRIRLKLG